MDDSSIQLKSLRLLFSLARLPKSLVLGKNGGGGIVTNNAVLRARRDLPNCCHSVVLDSFANIGGVMLHVISADGWLVCAAA